MSSELDVRLGIIGGSGVYQIDGVEVIKEHKIETPFGAPSDSIIEATINDRQVFFLPRHGRGHRLLPSEVNYRANIYALKSLAVTHILAVSAVGIMSETIRPGDMVIPSQIFDRTKGIRPSTFFGDGVVGHVEFADPFDHSFSDLLEDSARIVTEHVHRGGAYVCIEGPQFSTRAESHQYRDTLKPAIIGMTGIPEAKLAREAELCYAMLALATDYDCWHESEDDVSVEAVLKVLKSNTSTANAIVKTLATRMPKKASSPVFDAAKFAIITGRDHIPEHRRKELALLYGKYL